MGWLRDLMSSAVPPLRSYDEFARQALLHSAWPESSRMKSRSLSALLSKLDKKSDIEWLRDRPEIQGIFAELLGAPISSLRHRVDSEQRSVDRDAGLMRVPELRLARLLELSRESLPPGIPDALSHPDRWSQHCGIASSGDATDWVGRWLESRGRARYLRLKTAEELKGLSVDAQLPLFVVLQQGAAPVRPPVKLGNRLCIACPEGPPTGKTDSAWSLLRTPPATIWLDDLIDWAGERLPQDGQLAHEGSRRWLREFAEDGIVDNLHECLSLVGLVDDVGSRTARAKGLIGLAESEFSRRVTAAAKTHAGAHWLKTDGFLLLIELAKHMLCESPRSFTEVFSEDEWMRAVPEEAASHIDPTWVQRSLSESSSPATLREVNQALRRVPPGAYRIVRGLIASNVLVPDDGENFSIHPRWLAGAVLDRATQELLSGPSQQLGAALLHPQSAGPLIRGLYGATVADDVSAMEEGLELSSSASPQQVAVLEACVRTAGWACLEGVEASGDVASDLVEEQVELALYLEGLPYPRIGYDDPEPLLSHGSWLLACWALTEHHPGSETRPSLLCPWQLEQLPERLPEALELILSCLKSESDNDGVIVTEAIALISRLDEALGMSAEIEHPMLAPAALLRGLRADTDRLPPQLWQQVLESPFLLLALIALAERERIGFPTLAAAFWNMAGERGFDAPVRQQLETTSARPLWHAVPKTTWAVLLRVADWTLPFEAVHADAWPTLLALLATQPAIRRPAGHWNHCPATPLQQALALEKLCAEADGPMLDVLWSRYPAELRAQVRQTTEAPEDLARTLPLTAPPGQFRELLGELGEPSIATAARRAYGPALRGWLRRLRRRRSAA